MPHQCVHCGKVYPKATKALIEGCDDCGGRFFFYLKDEQLEKAKQTPAEQIPQEEKKKIERDVREMAGIKEEDAPVILDFESIKIVGDGKFELDVVNLFRQDRPLVYKLEEGKYIIDLASGKKKEKKE